MLIKNFKQGKCWKIGGVISIQRLPGDKIGIIAPKEMHVIEVDLDDAGVPSRPDLPTGDERDRTD